MYLTILHAKFKTVKFIPQRPQSTTKFSELHKKQLIKNVFLTALHRDWETETELLF